MKQATIAFFIPHLGCPQMCSFCNQRQISGTEQPPTAADVQKTCEEAIAQIAAKGRTQKTEIAFFGGSFTAIDPQYMLTLLKAAYPFVKAGKVSGIRVSTRPDAIDEQVLETLKNYGVTTIELGAQSMCNNVLEMAVRGHSAEDVENAARLIKAAGINLGLQMMLGLKGDSAEGALYTAKKIVSLAPCDVRIYPTVVLAGTQLAMQYQNGDYTPLTLKDGVALSATLMQMFEGAGINVIRVGLHASRDIEKSMVCGCYHPAFRELCESYIMLEKMKQAVQNGQFSDNNLLVYVNPQNLSKAVGQRKQNIGEMAKLGYSIKILPNPRLDLKSIAVTQKPAKEV